MASATKQPPCLVRPLLPQPNSSSLIASSLSLQHIHKVIPNLFDTTTSPYKNNYTHHQTSPTIAIPFFPISGDHNTEPTVNVAMSPPQIGNPTIRPPKPHPLLPYLR
ncbi:hypothetical protein HanRHA438_Chr16g0740871 [Helianthus annuus]|nr:hypothetical protein HanRHA438_Chr16g0740871 [Helianthus annuus]